MTYQRKGFISKFLHKIASIFLVILTKIIYFIIFENIIGKMKKFLYIVYLFAFKHHYLSSNLYFIFIGLLFANLDQF